MRFYPDIATWPLRKLRLEIDVAALQLVAREDRGSSADSERMAVLELVAELGARMQDRVRLKLDEPRGSRR